LIVVSLLFAIVLANLPTLVGFAQEQLQLGNMTYSRAEAPALRMPVTRSIRFFRGVGGVAFSAVAQGDGGLAVAGLRYDGSARDGQRLAITLRSRSGSLVTVRGDIHDWQLVPTARYARDENGSAVTLFGRLRDANATARLVRAGHRVINYHGALDNTLLGLRLFQADILIIRPEAADLFRQNGRPILGAGEGGHDRAKNLSRYQQLALWQDQQAEQGNQYQSYVVGDLGQRVAFGLREGSIVFSGEPFWHAWRAKHRTAADDAKRAALVDRYERTRLRARVMFDQGSRRRARQHLASLIDRFPAAPVLQLDAAMFALAEGDRHTARRLCETVASLGDAAQCRPGLSPREFNYVLGQAFWLLGRQGEAQESFRRTDYGAETWYGATMPGEFAAAC
jgi:hypothetical protein